MNRPEIYIGHENRSPTARMRRVYPLTSHRGLPPLLQHCVVFVCAYVRHIQQFFLLHKTCSVSTFSTTLCPYTYWQLSLRTAYTAHYGMRKCTGRGACVQGSAKPCGRRFVTLRSARHTAHAASRRGQMWSRTKPKRTCIK